MHDVADVLRSVWLTYTCLCYLPGQIAQKRWQKDFEDREKDATSFDMKKWLITKDMKNEIKTTSVAEAEAVLDRAVVQFSIFMYSGTWRGHGNASTQPRACMKGEVEQEALRLGDLFSAALPSFQSSNAKLSALPVLCWAGISHVIHMSTLYVQESQRP